jgi:hypothetical protein
VNARSGDAPILARDRDGIEHQLRVVDHPQGMVTLLDGDIQVTMAPVAAVELACRLVLATRRYFPGSISGTY